MHYLVVQLHLILQKYDHLLHLLHKLNIVHMLHFHLDFLEMVIQVVYYLLHLNMKDHMYNNNLLLLIRLMLQFHLS